MTSEAPEIPTEHPHIVRKPGTCGGVPIIRGTRITVRLIAALLKEGDTVDDILAGYAHLQPAWVHDAISYYFDHRQEIEKEIEENKIENVLSHTGAVMDEKGIVRFPKDSGNDGR